MMGRCFEEQTFFFWDDLVGLPRIFISEGTEGGGSYATRLFVGITPSASLVVVVVVVVLSTVVLR